MVEEFESGEIVYLHHGVGPRAKILFKNFTDQPDCYRVQVLENWLPYAEDEIVEVRDITLSKEPYAPY